VLRDRAFPTAMVLPQTFPATPEGSARAIRLFADAFGRRVIVYVKAENFLTPAACTMRLPVAVDPVKEIARTSGCRTSASPAVLP
jgi:hypothetical protein